MGHVAAPRVLTMWQIHTLLPVTDEAYQEGIETETMTLSQALDARNVANLPPLAAELVLTAEVGQKLKVLQQSDMANQGGRGSDSFWQKINWLDDTLHYAFSIPPHLAASGYNHTPISTFLHMCAPSSTILLHQAAEEQASAHGITPSSLLESQALRLAAAEMVASTMLLASQVDVRLLHPFTGSCLFTASRVLMRALTVRTDEGQQRSLKVLLDAMGQLQAVNPLTGGYFKDLDSEFPGMRKALSAQMQTNAGSGSQLFSGPDTPSTSSSYSHTPPLAPSGELPFANGFRPSYGGPDLGAPNAGELVSSTSSSSQPLYALANPSPVIASGSTTSGRDDQGGNDAQHELYFPDQDFFTQQ